MVDVDFVNIFVQYLYVYVVEGGYLDFICVGFENVFDLFFYFFGGFICKCNCQNILWCDVFFCY